MGSAQSGEEGRPSKRLKNAQGEPAPPPSSSPKACLSPVLAESALEVPGNNEATSRRETVFPPAEKPAYTVKSPPPIHSASADIPQEFSNFSNKTFRLRGIHKEWDRSRVKEQVKVEFRLPDAAQVHIRSISPDPSDSERQIATLDLTEMPNGIAHASHPSEWMPYSRGEDLVLDTNFFGLTPLHETDDAKCTLTVIAVPGLNGHAFGTFKARSRGRTYMWLRDSLSKDLPHARIFIFGYGTELQESKSFENIGDLALRLQHAIKVVSKNENSNARRNIVLIGHSLGGIVIKETLNKMFATQNTDGTNLESIRGLLFFGVPNQGMTIESLIPMVNNQPNRQLVETLNENSDVLRHVTNNFTASLKFSNAKVICFYETEKSPTAIQTNGIWTMSGPPQILVGRHSATERWQDKQDTRYPVKATHSGMVKFENKFEETYGTVLDHLRSFPEKAKVCIRKLSDSENDCLKSLSFPTQDTRQGNVYTAHGTCDWLVRHPTYLQWFSAHRQLLWINGKPGAGKSTMMKYLSNTLMDEKSSDDYILASFFVHGQGDEMERSKLGILRSLLHQILPQQPKHLSILTKKFVEREETRKGWAWSHEELMEVLRSIATQSHHASRPVIILVDALDELGESLAKDVVDFLGTLISHSADAKVSTTSTGRTYVGMRICFSSRHFPDITPPDCLKICVEKNNSDDIAKVVHEKLSVSRLSSIKEPEDPNLKELEGLIIEKADGVFQWVMLVIEQILKPLAASKKASALRMTVETLPSELAPLYSQILGNPSLETFQLLQWICFCRRPLELFELRQALALSSGQTYTSLEEYEKHFDYQLNEDKVHEMVKHLSCGLVEVKQNSPLPHHNKIKVGFIHQSVHDYLMKDGLLRVARGCGISSFLNPAKQDSVHLKVVSNAQMAAVCIKFLRSKEVQENLKKLKQVGFSATHLVLGNYATKNWLPHMTCSLIDNGLPDFLLELLLSSVGIIVPRLDRLAIDLRSSPFRECSCKYSKKSDDLFNRRRIYSGFKTMLHWLVAARSHAILSILTNCGQSLDTRDEKGRTPLMEAILAGDIKTTTLLLESGLVDVNCKDEQNQTPLHYAASDSLLLEIFSSLLKKNTIACDEIDQDGSTPLLRCLELRNSHSLFCSQHFVLNRTLWQAVQLLLDGKKVNPNQTDTKGDSILAHAARDGHSAIVELLINIPGVEINSRNKSGEPPIFHAVKAPQRETFTLLLKNEHLSLDLEDNSGRNALSYAAEWMGPQDVAKLVQKPNAELDKQDNSLRTPLSYSARRSGDVAQILLNTNAVDPFIRDKKGRSPVSYAAECSHSDAFERLWKFDNESNRWNEPDSSDRTPLSYAAQHNPTAVKLLLDGPQIARNQADRNGRTPLWYAVTNGNLESLRYFLSDRGVDTKAIDHPILHKAIACNDVLTASLLIQSGWDVNMKDFLHRTPLFYVRDIETADLLLKTEGIDLEVRDEDGRTALFCIAKNECPEVIRLLIEEYGFDDKVKDRSGLFPWHCARDLETKKLLFGPFKRFAREHRERRAARSILAANPKQR